ncbi:retrovirus-related pol polyprotein from transposon RE1 [Citrus sinensis]|nr:retrovirus-related pol polyprotein from transposon RE1 [Citrus sinensis]
MLQQILNGLGAGYLDLATFITASKLDYDDAYALLLTHEARLEQNQSEKHMINANYVNMSNWNNNSMMNAYYAQIRGHTRRGGYTGGAQGNYNGHSGGRNGMFNGRGMFLNSHPRGFPAGTDHFGNQGRNQMMMGSNRFGSSGRDSFGNTGFNGTGNLPPFESQVSNSNNSMNTCQICFKVGHTAVECWHKFEENYIPQSPRQFQRGKGSKSAYIANYEPAYIPYYPTNDDPWPVNNNGLHMSQSGYPCASDNSGMPWVGTASAAYCEGPADEGWYLDSGATHHLTNSMGNLNIRDEFRGNEKLIIGNGEGLSITHIGDSYFSFKNSKSQPADLHIALKNILLVPSITKNLISISKLTTDNNISVEFLGSFYVVKDLLKRQVLMQGIAEKELYKLLVKPMPSTKNSSLSHSQANKPLSMLSFCHLAYHMPSVKYINNSNNCLQNGFDVCSDKPNKIALLHRRFGHPNSQSLLHLPKLHHADKFSLNMVKQATQHFCEACQLDPAFNSENKTQSISSSALSPHQVFHLSNLPVVSNPYNSSFESYSPACSSSTELFSSTDHQQANEATQCQTPNLNPALEPVHDLDSPNTTDPTQIPLPSQSQITSNNIQHVQNNHPMTTRGKAGIFKPKMYTTVLVHKEPDSVGEALQDTNWFTAMKNEYDALIENRTWSLVPRTENQKVVGNKWVYRIKYNTDGSVAKYKARLVAKGCQQIEGVNYFDTFSPVVKPATVRVVLSLAVMNQWIVRQVDVNNAFLNGELSEEVFMQQPEGFVDKSKSNHVCRLHKALYGLKQAPRACGKDSKLQKVVKGELGYYVEDATHYRSIVGGLQYLILTRPEIAYFVHKLSQYVSAPTMQHLMACKRVLKYLKKTQDYGLKFVKDGDLKITAFTDADWGSDLDDRKSIGAYCVYLGNNLISWSSKKQTVVTKSSAESEYRALASAASEIAWLKSLFLEMEVYCVERPTIWCDNISATELAKNLVFHSRTKHIEIDVHFIRDKVLSGDLKICYVPSEDQIADILTKPLSSPQFNYLRDNLNVFSCPLSLRGAVKIAHCAEVRKKSQRVKLPVVICATSEGPRQQQLPA